MKHLSKKVFGAVAAAVVLSVALTGCKPYVAPANELSGSAADERCVVLGSNITEVPDGCDDAVAGSIGKHDSRRPDSAGWAEVVHLRL